MYDVKGHLWILNLNFPQIVLKELEFSFGFP
jgi:hypothetical protein